MCLWLVRCFEAHSKRVWEGGQDFSGGRASAGVTLNTPAHTHTHTHTPHALVVPLSLHERRHRQTGRQAGRRVGRRAARQADRQADSHISLTLLLCFAGLTLLRVLDTRLRHAYMDRVSKSAKRIQAYAGTLPIHSIKGQRGLCACVLTTIFCILVMRLICRSLPVPKLYMLKPASFCTLLREPDTHESASMMLSSSALTRHSWMRAQCAQRASPYCKHLIFIFRLTCRWPVPKPCLAPHLIVSA